jgi:hypothetical protein
VSADESPLSYRLITGPDDRTFCERVTAALADGYILHGSPSVTFNGTSVICAQAVIHPTAVAASDAAIATAVQDLDYDGEGHA